MPSGLHPPSEVPRGVVDIGQYANWENQAEKNQVEMNQAEKALEYFKSLAAGSVTTELESRFILSPRHFDQFMSRFSLGNMNTLKLWKDLVKVRILWR